jgi:hypothetical protein
VAVVDEDGSEGVEESEAVAAPVPEPAPRNPRQVRARRRRRRRQFGTLLFLLVAGGIFATAYFAVTADDDSTDEATSTTLPAGGTTTTLPAFAGSYKVTTGVNVRQGAGTTFPAVGVVEQGRTVLVICVVEGEIVNAPSGPNSQWLKVTGLGPSGYASAAFVAVGDDLRNKKIPTCPPA